jgi:hypothetical protein
MHILCGRQSNITLKDVNMQEAKCFGLKLTILRPYKEHFRQNIDYVCARIACYVSWLLHDWSSKFLYNILSITTVNNYC